MSDFIKDIKRNGIGVLRGSSPAVYDNVPSNRFPLSALKSSNQEGSLRTSVLGRFGDFNGLQCCPPLNYSPTKQLLFLTSKCGIK